MGSFLDINCLFVAHIILNVMRMLENKPLRLLELDHSNEFFEIYMKQLNVHRL